MTNTSNWLQRRADDVAALYAVPADPRVIRP